MIINRLCGGLGNQLFQYAMGYSLASRNNTTQKLDITGYVGRVADKNKGVRTFDLQNFNISSPIAADNDLSKFSFYTDNKFFKHLIRFYRNNKSFYKRKYILEPEDKYFLFDKRILERKMEQDVCLEGYWLSEKYFESVETEIRREFTFKDVASEINSKYIRNINETNSVSIHIRCTDNQLIKNGILPIEYYEKAMEEITKRVDNPTFYVFSDNPEWAMKNLTIKYPIVFISHNKNADFEDLRLMTFCKHSIIANSTFSWWGAWLGKKDGQIVICPNKHLSTERDLTKTDYIPKNWLVIKV
jgi:hypothetical protein